GGHRARRSFPTRRSSDLRARGYALAVDDGYPGVWSVGTVLPWHGQRPMAVSLDVPAYAASPEKLHGLGRMLVEKMARFSGTVFQDRKSTRLNSSHVKSSY